MSSGRDGFFSKMLKHGFAGSLANYWRRKVYTGWPSSLHPNLL